MSKHTPGPWKAHFEEAYFVTAPDLGRVAMMMNLKGAHGMGGRRSGDESAANCRLIAAAPDLLAVAQFFLRGIEGGHIRCAPYIDFDPNAETLEIKSPAAWLRAAIAKATAGAGGADAQEVRG